jgi:hypothetical protein
VHFVSHEGTAVRHFFQNPSLVTNIRSRIIDNVPNDEAPVRLRFWLVHGAQEKDIIYHVCGMHGIDVEMGMPIFLTAMTGERNNGHGRKLPFMENVIDHLENHGGNIYVWQNCVCRRRAVYSIHVCLRRLHLIRCMIILGTVGLLVVPPTSLRMEVVGSIPAVVIR